VASGPSIGGVLKGFERIQVLVEKIGRQTHAGAAMLTAAALDRLLETALLARFARNSREVRDSIFGDFGVLRDFSAKIELCFALGIVDRETQKKLNAIRRIRNLFAHSRDYINFDSLSIQALVTKELGSTVEISSIESFLSVAEEVEARVCELSGLPQDKIVSNLKDIL
jgi:DNA-binding MltR family transcriptional regulator